MFGKTKRKMEAERVERAETQNAERAEHATKLVKSALDAADENLAVKREVREKAARFIGSLRPALKAVPR